MGNLQLSDSRSLVGVVVVEQAGAGAHRCSSVEYARVPPRAFQFANVDTPRHDHLAEKFRGKCPKLDLLRGLVRKHEDLPAENRKTLQKGSLVLHLIVLWLPIIAIFGVTLWLQSASLQYLLRQRSLDRCLFSALNARCETISQISEQNARLRFIQHVLFGLKTGSIIPYVGQAIKLFEGLSAPALRTAAHAIKTHQDLLIANDAFALARTLSCGIPVIVPQPLRVSRPQTAESSVTKAPPPLVWDAGEENTNTHLRSWRWDIESFAHCHASKSQPVALSGETYATRFVLSNKNAGDKPLWKRFSF